MCRAVISCAKLRIGLKLKAMVGMYGMGAEKGSHYCLKLAIYRNLFLLKHWKGADMKKM